MVRDVDGLQHRIEWRDGSPPDELARLEIVVTRILEDVSRSLVTRDCPGWLEQCLFTTE